MQNELGFFYLSAHVLQEFWNIKNPQRLLSSLQVTMVHLDKQRYPHLQAAAGNAVSFGERLGQAGTAPCCFWKRCWGVGTAVGLWWVKCFKKKHHGAVETKVTPCLPFPIASPPTELVGDSKC